MRSANKLKTEYEYYNKTHGNTHSTSNWDQNNYDASQKNPSMSFKMKKAKDSYY